MERIKATATSQIENDRVRVVRWDFEGGAETGWHKHSMDYIVVPLTTGSLTAELPDGTQVTNQLTAGQSYNRPEGVHHNIINSSDVPFSFIEIELK